MPTSCLRDGCGAAPQPRGRLCAPHWWELLESRGEQVVTDVPSALDVPGLVVTVSSRPSGAPSRLVKDPTLEVWRAYMPPVRVGQFTYRAGTGTQDGSSTVVVRRIEVAASHRRRGFASALYELMRTRHPDAHVLHGARTRAGEQWWPAFCAARGLDPDDPAS